MSNPIFQRVDREGARGYAGFAPHQPTGLSAGQLQSMYSSPAMTPPHELRVTAEDVMRKAGILMSIVIVVAAVSAAVSALIPGVGMLMWLGGMIATLILGFVIAAKKTVSVPLIVGYAVLEGVFVGAVSQSFSTIYSGAVPTAVVATLCVVVAMFVGWRAGYVRVTDRFRRIMGMALVGYLIFALVNLVAAFMGVGAGWGFGGTGPLGIIISLFATGLAALTLALDFDSIDRAVHGGAPARYSWLLAHGLVVTVVWLYIEMLRLISRFQSR